MYGYEVALWHPVLWTVPPCLHGPGRMAPTLPGSNRRSRVWVWMDKSTPEWVRASAPLIKRKFESRMIILSSFHVCWGTPKNTKHGNITTLNLLPPGGCPKAPAASALELTTDKWFKIWWFFGRFTFISSLQCLHMFTEFICLFLFGTLVMAWRQNQFPKLHWHFFCYCCDKIFGDTETLQFASSLEYTFL